MNEKVINGHYLIDQEIGRGGMGIVYRATNRLNGDIVALKQVTGLGVQFTTGMQSGSGHSEDDLRLALAREFQILAGLRHPNIISVLDYGFNLQRQPFFTMTYLPNSKNILEEGQHQELAQKISLIQQLLQALAYLHRRGVLHRDLKPDNILIENGVVRVLDFGLAANEHFREKGLVGTPLYMAPELLEANRYTETADLFVVGLIFYELLAGEHPFAPFDHSFLDRVEFEDPDWEPIPTSLRPFLKALLQKKPELRPKNANEAFSRLAQALGQPLPPETKAIRESYLQAARFIGRKNELAKLTTALNQASNQTGSAWLLGGESGVGKSRLLREIETIGRVEGFQILHGQAIQEQDGVPYQLWREPLRQLIVTLPDIDNLTAGVLLSLVPDIAQLLDRPVDPAPELEAAQTQLRLFTTIARLFRRAERPLLLILEDLHWASESLLLLPYLTRSIGEESILLIGSYRSDERVKLPESLSEMELISLPRLTSAEMADLSVAMLGTAGKREEILTLIQKETEGNTFFAVEVVRALAEEVGRLEDIGQAVLPEHLLPNGIKDIVQRRLDRLPPQAVTLLTIAAAAGLEIDVQLIAHLDKENDIENWWLPLCAEAAVLEVNQDNWQFSHGKIRDGLLSQLPPEEKIKVHRDIARGIEFLYSDSAGISARLAHHWGEAKENAKARAYSIQAGEEATRQFSNDEAIMHFSRALALTSKDQVEQIYQVLDKRAELYNLIADRQKQRADLSRLVEIADQLEDASKKGAVALKETDFFSRTGRYDASIKAAKLTVELGEKSGERVLIGEGHSRWGQAARNKGDLDSAHKHIEYAVQIFRELDDLKRLSYSLNALGIVFAFLGDTETQKQHFEESLKLALQQNDIQLQSRLYNNLSLYHAHKAEYGLSRSYLEQGLNLHQATGDRFGEAIAYQNKGIELFTIGDYQSAFKYENLSAKMFREIGDPFKEDYALYFISLIAERMGASSQAEEILKESLTFVQQPNLLKSKLDRLIMLGFLYGAQGKDQMAIDLFNELLDQFETEKSDPIMAKVYYYKAEILKKQKLWQSAGNLYAKSLKHLNEHTHERLYKPAQSGYANMLFQTGEQKQALELVGPLFDHLLHQSWNHGRHDVRMALECVEILQSINDERAWLLLERAFETLQWRASFIEGEDSKRFALEEVEEHREIIRLYTESLQPSKM